MVDTAFSLKLGRLGQEREEAAWGQHNGSRQVRLQHFHQLPPRMGFSVCRRARSIRVASLSHSSDVFRIGVHEIAGQLVSASLVVLQRGQFGLKHLKLSLTVVLLSLLKC